MNNLALMAVAASRAPNVGSIRTNALVGAMLRSPAAQAVMSIRTYDEVNGIVAENDALKAQAGAAAAKIKALETEIAALKNPTGGAPPSAGGSGGGSAGPPPSSGGGPPPPSGGGAPPPSGGAGSGTASTAGGAGVPLPSAQVVKLIQTIMALKTTGTPLDPIYKSLLEAAMGPAGADVFTAIDTQPPPPAASPKKTP